MNVTARRAPAALMLAATVLCSAVFTAPVASAGPAREPPAGLTRSEVLARARSWVDVNVKYTPYDDHATEYGTYRRDCSGFVSMAWGLTPSGMGAPTTASLPDYGTWLPSLDDLQPGDAIDDPGSHVVLFVGWADGSHTVANVYEQGSAPGAVASRYSRTKLINGGYRPLRYRGVIDDPAPQPVPRVGHDVPVPTG